jgi:hypothetical protein
MDCLLILLIPLLLSARSSAEEEVVPQTSDRARIAAMLSIHAHAFWPDRSWPAELGLPSLDDAVSVLVKDEDRVAPSRRRRAVARLSAYGMVLGSIESFREAIRRLGADPKQIEDAVAHRFNLSPRSPSGLERAKLDVLEVEPLVYDLVVQNFEVSGCKTTTLKTDSSDSGPTATVYVEIAVDRALDDVARALDPQKWDQCSKFFKPPENTYLATLQNGLPVPAKVIGAGTAYGTATKTTLFEHFECGIVGCPTWFENMLGVETVRDVTTNGYRRYSAFYYLDQAIAGTGKLAIDQGHSIALEESANLTKVEGKKSIAMAQPGTNGVVAGSLLHAELAGELAEIVCCVVPP